MGAGSTLGNLYLASFGLNVECEHKTDLYLAEYEFQGFSLEFCEFVS